MVSSDVVSNGSRMQFYRPLGYALILSVTFACQRTVLAVVVHEAGSAELESAPEDDPGFANVGVRGGGTGVYLGNRWVLTAQHVRVGPIVLNGVVYANVVDETVLIPNPHGEDWSLDADLMLLRLREDPGLPSLRLNCNAVELGQEVMLIGGGRERSELLFWEVEELEGDDNDIWTEVATEEESDFQGYLTTNSQVVRWGPNQIAEIDVETESDDWGNVLSFRTEFDASLGTVSHGVRGDSGGAVFQKNGSVWELAGIMHAIGLAENQPDGSNTAVFGASTYIADLFVYAEALRGLADFEPAAGDADGDGIFSADDLDALQQAMRDDRYNCHFDLNGDEVIDEADLQAMYGLAQTRPGDTNLDGIVGFEDFLTMANSYALPGGWADGDFTGDGRIDFPDFLVLADSYGDASPLSAATLFSVPEPSQRLGFALSLCVLFASSRRRQSR